MARSLGEFGAGSNPVYEGTGLADTVGGWRAHAISENGSLKGDEPGTTYNRYTAMVPVSTLAKFREYDRSGRDANAGSPATVSKIAQDLANGGKINEPISLAYDHSAGWGVIAEGNHRLAAAIQAGVSHVPVTVQRGDYAAMAKRSGKGSPLHIDRRIVEQYGYFPSMIHPGNFMEFAGAR